MTKKETADRIRNIIGWQFDRRQVYAVVDSIFSQQMYNLAKMGKELDSFTKEYTVSISTDAVKNVKYATLPKQVVSLPNEIMAIRHVNTTQGTGFTFFPLYEKDHNMSSGLDSDTVTTSTDTQTGFKLINNRIEFYNLPASVTAVRADLVITFDEYEETDEVKMPFGNDSDIMKEAINILLQKQPEVKTDSHEYK